jgi:hypothetical protein
VKEGDDTGCSGHEHNERTNIATTTTTYTNAVADATRPNRVSAAVLNFMLDEYEMSVGVTEELWVVSTKVQ